MVLKILFPLFIVLCLAPTFLFATDKSEEKWKGVDEAIIEKIAKEHGREPKEPLINTDSGDILLFAFLSAGALGGFAIGYYWRVIIEQKENSHTKSLSD
ncbi:MAG: hypothetical protein N2738_02420 [Thermodesulfovibrionales bacterium]|nr:hypothetical protein [Thermodesulfovibrionales bacterium]